MAKTTKKAASTKSGRPLKRILSIHGGGIRGIVPAVVLAKLEELTGKPIADCFDLIAGTSTGGILAAGLTVPGQGSKNKKKPRYTALDMVNLYEEQGPRIFSRNIWHRLHSANGITEEKYPADGIEAVLKETFGDARLADCLTHLLIPAYEIEQRTPFFFRSAKAKATPTYNHKLIDACRATSAAPTYFEPHKLVSQDGDVHDYYSLVDGGLYANNPALCALAESSCLFAEEAPCDVMLVSIGTGELTRPYPHEDAKDWGMAKWVQPVIDICFDGVSDTVDYQAQQLIQGMGKGSSFHRLQVRLTTGSDAMDDASRTNTKALKDLAQSLLNNQSKSIQAIAKAIA